MTAVSETNLGRVLNELAAEVYVGTKFRVTTNEPREIKENVIASVEASLARMQREQVDLIPAPQPCLDISRGRFGFPR